MPRERHSMRSSLLRKTNYWTHANAVKDAWNEIKYQKDLKNMQELHEIILLNTVEMGKIIDTLSALRTEVCFSRSPAKEMIDPSVKNVVNENIDISSS